MKKPAESAGPGASPPTEGSAQTSGVSRRTFLSGLLLLPVPLLAVAEPLKAQPAVLPPAARRRAIVMVLEEAQRTRNMNAAIEKHGKSLTADEKRILLGISAGELAALQSARSKLGLRAPP